MLNMPTCGTELAPNSTKRTKTGPKCQITSRSSAQSQYQFLIQRVLATVLALVVGQQVIVCYDPGPMSAGSSGSHPDLMHTQHLVDNHQLRG